MYYQARKKAMTYLAKAANQEDPQSHLDAHLQLKTIDELCAAYIENHAKKKKKTWKDDQSSLNRFVLSTLSGRLAVSLVTADIEAIHSEVGVEHPYAANDVLKVIRKMFNWGKVAGRDVASSTPAGRRRDTAGGAVSNRGGNAIAFDSTTGRASLGNFRPLRHRKGVTRSVPPGT